MNTTAETPDPQRGGRPKGLCCPLCGATSGFQVYGTRKPTVAMKLRYVACECGARFTTEERVGRLVRSRPKVAPDEPGSK